jgi:hypothetical protein
MLIIARRSELPWSRAAAARAHIALGRREEFAAIQQLPSIALRPRLVLPPGHRRCTSPIRAKTVAG